MYPVIFLEVKKNNMERLKFYNIEDKYIEYLYQFDNKVPYNKNNKRPYIGIVLEINNITYFAPMFSPKPQHRKYKSNATYIKIGENLGIIRLNNMIPVCKENLRYIDFNKIQDKKYRNLLIQQNNFIQLHTEKIRDTANKLYKFVTRDKKEFFIKICCDFKLLENKCRLFNNIKDKEEVNINNTEITCEVFEKLDTIKQKLESNNFEYVEEFTLDDIYMCNMDTKQYVPKNGKITDALIIRYTNDNKEIISKKRAYNSDGFEIGTEKTVLKIDDIKNAERLLNNLGFTRFLRMIDKNYCYENTEYIAYIQVIDNLGIFLEIESKSPNSKEKEIENLINIVQSLQLKIGTKFDIRKAELLYKKLQNS